MGININGKYELYAYTTDVYKREGIIKVGHATRGRHKVRINEQFGTSNPERPIYYLIGNLPEGITDKTIHSQLIKNGCKKVKNSSGKEWFHANLKDVKRAYSEVVLGTSRINTFPPRDEQQEASDKAVQWFLKKYPDDVINSATHPNRFLINAKMRFGKCFTGINIAKALGAKKTLIVTYKPDVISEWIDTVNEHVAFIKWMGIRARFKKTRPIDPILNDSGDFPKNEGPIVLCVSLQDLEVSKSGQTKERLHKILSKDWDLVIFDEVHYGSRTPRAQHILDSIKFICRLDLSGTPFRLIEQDDFCAQQVYTYSYLDEQKKKKAEVENSKKAEVDFIYRQLPDLNISTIEITDEDIEQQVETFRTDDIDFSLNRLFETNNGKFIHDEAVNHFINGLTKNGHDARSISIFGELGTKLGVPPKRHTVWWLRKVESITALIKKLEKHHHFSNFKIINASGSDSAKKESSSQKFIARDKSIVLEAISDSIQDSNCKGTITLTCGRFLTGVTIKEWDSILILNDVSSAESYFQAIFRVQSSWAEEANNSLNIIKPVSWVFDFAISRCLKVIYDCAINISDQIEQQESYEQKTDLTIDHLQITTEGLCKDLDIKRFFEGSLSSKSTNSDDIFQAANHEGARLSLARRITSNMLVNFGSLKLLDEHPYLFEILKKVKGYRTQDVGIVDIKELVKIGLDSDKLDEIKNDQTLNKDDKEDLLEDFVKNEKDKKRQKRKKWYATQIKRLAICMADFIYMTYEREIGIDDVVNTKSPEFFEIMTGISKDDFNLLCEHGFINKLSLNRIVRQFKDQENSSLNPDEYIRDNITKLAA